MKYFLLLLAFSGAYGAWAMDGVRMTSKLSYDDAVAAYKTVFSDKNDAEIQEILTRHYDIIKGAHEELSSKLAELRSQWLTEQDPKIVACQKLLEVYPGAPKPDAAADSGEDSSDDDSEENAFESGFETDDTVIDENI